MAIRHSLFLAKRGRSKIQCDYKNHGWGDKSMSWIFTALTIETGLSQIDLRKLIETAPRRYKVFEIPKRSGGMRTIAQPSREIKLLQRVLIPRLTGRLASSQRCSRLSKRQLDSGKCKAARGNRTHSEDGLHRFFSFNSRLGLGEILPRRTDSRPGRYRVIVAHFF